MVTILFNNAEPLNKLENIKAKMLHKKTQPQSFLGSGKEDFKCLLPYMGMAAILLNEENHLNKLTISFRQDPMWYLVKIS